MGTWKRDFVSGLVVLGPILVTLFVISALYGFIEGLIPGVLLTEDRLQHVIADAEVRERVTALVRVLSALVILAGLSFLVGKLMRTTAGEFGERIVDGLANTVPGLRVVYNASKLAAETVLGDDRTFHAPVTVETWTGRRMTAFRTGKTTEDGYESLFLPLSPNITTGFVIEVKPEQITERDEDPEDALTRILSAGFGGDDRDEPVRGGQPADGERRKGE